MPNYPFQTSFWFYKCPDLKKNSDYTVGPFISTRKQKAFFDYNYSAKYYDVTKPDTLQDTVIALTSQYYQRTDLGYFEVEKDYDTLLDRNYMIFQNSQSGKYFYAFVDRVEYVSDLITRVYYTIDVMQTYFAVNPSARILPCYIERQHTSEDKNDEVNILDDYPASNVYVEGQNHYSERTPFSHLVIVTQAPENMPESQESTGPLVGFAQYVVRPTITYGLLNSANTFIYSIPFNADNAQEISNTLKTELSDNGRAMHVIAMYMAHVPYQIGTNEIAWTAMFKEKDAVKILSLGPQEGVFKYINPIDGKKYYTPRNQKAYTFPYSYVFVFNGENEKQYNPALLGTIDEEDEEGNIFRYYHFDKYTTVYPQPSIALVPTQYAGSQEDNLDYESASVIDRQTNLMYQGSAQQEWIETNGRSIRTDLIYNALKTIAGAGLAAAGIPGAGAPMVSSGTAGITSTLIETKKKKQQLASGPQPQRGGYTPSTFITAADVGFTGYEEGIDQPKFHQAGIVTILNGSLVYEGVDNPGQLYGNGFMLGFKTITGEEMQIIDEYWTKYGYPVRKVETPQFESRETWNYVETKDAVLRLSISEDIKKQISEKLDNGFTFWHTAENEDGSWTPIYINDYTQVNDAIN